MNFSWYTLYASKKRARFWQKLVRPSVDRICYGAFYEMGIPGALVFCCLCCKDAILYGLRGFQLKTKVTVRGERVSTNRNDRRRRIRFETMKALVLDRYDWDYSEHITVPNPDFGSGSAGAVSPGDRTVTVYHRNAGRVEQAGLAAPYNAAIGPWDIRTSLLAPQEVDPDSWF